MSVSVLSDFLCLRFLCCLFYGILLETDWLIDWMYRDIKCTKIVQCSVAHMNVDTHNVDVDHKRAPWLPVIISDGCKDSIYQSLMLLVCKQYVYTYAKTVPLPHSTMLSQALTIMNAVRHTCSEIQCRGCQPQHTAEWWKVYETFCETLPHGAGILSHCTTCPHQTSHLKQTVHYCTEPS